MNLPKIVFIVILLGWVIEMITRIVTYNEKGLFDSMYEDVFRVSLGNTDRWTNSNNVDIQKE